MRARFTLAFSALALVLVATPAARAAVRTAPEAGALLDAQKFPEAERAYAAFLATNPFNGATWSNYGFCLHPQKKYDEAIAAWRKAIELGANPVGNTYNICCAQSLAGRTDEAIATLRQALDMGFTEDETLQTDTDLDPLRADPRFKELLGVPPEGLSRDERWRFDLDYFARRMRQMHYNLYAKISREDFAAEVAAIKKDVPGLDDDAIAFRIRRLLARVGDGHTTMSRLRPGQTKVPRLPVELYLYSDGLYVRSAAPGFEDIVGARVDRIGPLTAQAALGAMRAYTSVDNAMGYKDQSVAYLSVPAALVAIGAAPDVAHASFTLTPRSGGAVTRELSPLEFDADWVRPTEIGGYTRANKEATAPEPLYLQHPERNLWFEHLPEDHLVYACFRAIADDKEETLEAFWKRVFEFIDANEVDRLVIDMRHNGGGNTGLVMPFLHGLIRADRVNKPGSLFVIIGRRTFSAAMNTASLIEMHTNVTFVGEPTGSRPNFVGESTSFLLPCNNLKVYCSSRYWQHVTSLDKREWIAPHLAAELSFADFAANRDPAMETILAAIRAKPATTEDGSATSQAR